MNCLVYYCDANVKISVGRFYKRAKCKFFGAILLLQTIGPMLSKYAVEYFAILILISFADVIVMGKTTNSFSPCAETSPPQAISSSPRPQAVEPSRRDPVCKPPFCCAPFAPHCSRGGQTVN